jgi:predicted Zn-dependent protease
VVVALLFPAVACSINPATGQNQLSFIGEQQEIALGRQNDEQIVQTMGLYPDEDLQAYVSRVGSELAAQSERPDLPWTFRVIDDPVVNAFALPGGFVYLTRGILTYLGSEAEMAGVLGHEIGHVTARHSVEQISRAQLAGIGLGIGMVLSEDLRQYGGLAQAGLGLLFLKYGRDDERQADDLGLRYMTRQSYDPRSMPEVFHTLERVSAAEGGGRVPEWLSTHPDPGQRAVRQKAEIEAAVASMADPRVERTEYLSHVDDVVFGDDPRQGFFKGSSFYHPELAFRLDFPDGWKTINQRSQVAATSPGQDAVVLLSLAQEDNAGAAAQAFFAQQGVSGGSTSRRNIGGLSAVTGGFSVPREQQTDLQGVAAFVEHGGQVFALLGFTVENQSNAYRDALSKAVYSFRPITDRRYLDVKPARLDVVRLPAAMTLRQFAERYPSSVDLERLALINQTTPDQRFAAGDRLKRVVGGELPK